MPILKYVKFRNIGWYCFWRFRQKPTRYFTTNGWKLYKHVWVDNDFAYVKKNLLCFTREEIEQRVRKHFEKHPEEFAEYVAQRMGVRV